MDEDIKKLCALIEKVTISDDVSWQSKRDAIRTECDSTILADFIAWFEEDEEDDE